MVHSRDQYEALGRFVEAFEAMVAETRETCINLLARSGRHRDLIEIAFHHNVLTAKPVYEIMRAIIAELVNASMNKRI
jgi:hypothetical protein